MSVYTSSNRKIFYIIIPSLLVIFILWFSYMYIVTAKTEFMENKIKSSMYTGLQIVVPNTPRVLYTNDGGFYAPDLLDPPQNMIQGSKLFDIVLESVNDDSTVPPCKISDISLIMHSFPDIQATTAVEFYVLPGITKTITITSSIKTPKYKELTGLEQE